MKYLKNFVAADLKYQVWKILLGKNDQVWHYNVEIIFKYLITIRILSKKVDFLANIQEEKWDRVLYVEGPTKIMFNPKELAN